MSKLERAEYRGLRVSAPGDDGEQENDTWVVFVHQCEAKKGQEGQVEFSTRYGPMGVAEESCCDVVVPADVWKRWQRAGAFERAMREVRGRRT